jgi:hypothetical protein
MGITIPAELWFALRISDRDIPFSRILFQKKQARVRAKFYLSCFFSWHYEIILNIYAIFTLIIFRKQVKQKILSIAIGLCIVTQAASERPRIGQQ